MFACELSVPLAYSSSSLAGDEVDGATDSLAKAGSRAPGSNHCRLPYAPCSHHKSTVVPQTRNILLRMGTAHVQEDAGCRNSAYILRKYFRICDFVSNIKRFYCYKGITQEYHVQG